MKIYFEASMACANYANLEKDLRSLENAKIDYLHIDIMDGHYVPNFGLNFDMMRTFGKLTNIPMECHLMVKDPDPYIETVIELGAEYVSVHYEATVHVQRVLQQIRQLGSKASIALNPATPLTALDCILEDLDMVTIMTVNPGFAGQKLVPATLRKISDLKERLIKEGLDHVRIQADGNVSFENIPKMVEAGADMLVGGTSSIFNQNFSIEEGAERVRSLY